MWKGKKLHETAISPDHEIDVELDGVKGRIDEIIFAHDESYTARAWLIDKKFVSFLPSSERDVKKYYSHYILQLELYAYIYTTDIRTPVEGCILLFVNTDDEPYFYVYTWKPDLAGAEQKFIDLRERASKLLAEEDPPERNPEFQPASYPCSYCDYMKKCWLNGFEGGEENSSS